MSATDEPGKPLSRWGIICGYVHKRDTEMLNKQMKVARFGEDYNLDVFITGSGYIPVYSAL